MWGGTEVDGCSHFLADNIIVSLSRQMPDSLPSHRLHKSNGTQKRHGGSKKRLSKDPEDNDVYEGVRVSISNTALAAHVMKSATLMIYPLAFAGTQQGRQARRQGHVQVCERRVVRGRVEARQDGWARLLQDAR